MRDLIITRLIGGLGNQLFQYSAGLALSKRLSMTLLIDISGFKKYNLHKYSLHHFNIDANIASQSELKKFYGRRESSLFDKLKYKIFKKENLIYKEKKRGFDEDIFSLNSSIYLDGFWQSEKYFKFCEQEIRKQFCIKSALNQKTKNLVDSIKECNAVSVHIRRADYVKNKTTNRIHGSLDFEYYEKGIEYLNSVLVDNHFFIFSDDPEWVQKNFNLATNCTFVSHNNAENNYQDLNLMSYCNHHIIANSTFSWWGAWLSSNKNKKVVAPKNWYSSSKSFNKDLFLDDWIEL